MDPNSFQLLVTNYSYYDKLKSAVFRAREREKQRKLSIGKCQCNREDCPGWVINETNLHEFEFAHIDQKTKVADVSSLQAYKDHIHIAEMDKCNVKHRTCNWKNSIELGHFTVKKSNLII